VRIAFGDCVLDADARLLTRAGRAVKLPPKAFRILECLLERRPSVLTHQQLKDLVWPRTFVGYTSLSKEIHRIRCAIGDDPRRPRWVRTVSGMGYAFATDAREQPVAAGAVPARFALRWRSREFELPDGESLVGRDAACAVRVASLRVSRRHARIVVCGDRATLEDLGSKNGTQLNGRRIARPASVSDGDEILVGDARMRFAALGPAGTTHTDRLPPAKRREKANDRETRAAASERSSSRRLGDAGDGDDRGGRRPAGPPSGSRGSVG
jgi:DNA-binding winged helix-turn-helix (wHTH) protein